MTLITTRETSDRKRPPRKRHRVRCNALSAVQIFAAKMAPLQAALENKVRPFAFGASKCPGLSERPIPRHIADDLFSFSSAGGAGFRQRPSSLCAADSENAAEQPTPNSFSFDVQGGRRGTVIWLVGCPATYGGSRTSGAGEREPFVALDAAPGVLLALLCGMFSCVRLAITSPQ